METRTSGASVYEAGEPPPDEQARIVAPAAVRLVDLEAPLEDLQLPRTQLGDSYRSLLLVVRLDGDPVGAAVVAVDATGTVARDRLGFELSRQLGVELGGASARCATPAPGRRRSVSVVVTTCCDPVALEPCVESILACDYDDFEVIVVENRPGPSATRLMLAERFTSESRLRYVEEGYPGLARARNAGLACADGEVVAFTDDDVVVDRAWIRRCAQAFDAAPDVACVTGLILPRELETDSQLLLEQFARFGKGFRRRTYRLPEARKADPLFPYTPGVIGSGANTAVLAGAARRLGGFDTKLGAGTPATGGEDLDLYIRLLRGGHAVAYEPGAIVWHAHRDGMRKLRRQVYRYGVAMGATLGKQLIAGPERLELLRAVPAGVRYTRDPSSRKNAGKRSDYPGHLELLERLGLLMGPPAYVASAIVTASRHPPPLSRQSTGDGQAVHTQQHVLASGETIEVVEPVAAAPAIAGPAERAFTAAAVAACIAAPLSVLLGLPTALRFPAVLALLCLAPGIALISVLGGTFEIGLAVGTSLAASAIVAQSMLWLHAWEPKAFLTALAVVCLPALTGRLAAGRPARSAGIGRPRSPHAVLLVVAMGLWGASLAGAHLDRMSGLGLLNAMPPTYFLAFALLLGGFAHAVTRGEPSPRLLVLYVLALIVVLHGTTPLLYDQPRYPWTYKHLGVIQLIAHTGVADRDIDVYNNWPTFFAANAWLSRTTGLAPIDYAAWAQLFFNLVAVAAFRFALKGLTRDERLLWTASWFFVLGNWVGQDYLAPQAFAFVLSLVTIGICLRRPRAAPLLGGLCFLVVVTSHQLSPILLILSVAALAVIPRRVPLWVPAAMIVIEAWWLSLAWPFIDAHFTLISPGGAGGGAVGRDTAAALPGAILVFYAPVAVVAIMYLLGLTGGVRTMLAGKPVVTAACLAAAPLLGFALQSYGGEGFFRAYLFGLPWLAFFAALACMRNVSESQARVGFVPLTVATGAVGVCLLVAYFGQELVNRVRTDEVRADVWYEQHAPARSVALYLAPLVPDHLTASYPPLQNGAALLNQPAFRGHRLGAGDLPRLERVAQEYAPRRVFVLLSKRQEDYGRFNGLLPAGSVTSLAHALHASPDFQLTYHRPTAWVFEFER